MSMWPSWRNVCPLKGVGTCVTFHKIFTDGASLDKNVPGYFRRYRDDYSDGNGNDSDDERRSFTALSVMG